MEKFITSVVGAVLGILLMVVVGLVVGSLFAFPVLWIWNWMMPELFGLSTLTFWQAFWGAFLTKLLFANSATVNKK